MSEKQHEVPVVRAMAIGIGPGPRTSHPEGTLDPCAALALWAEVAEVVSPRGGAGSLAVVKSDLLNRLIYGGERGPSKTPCPVHKGVWSGCHIGWPGSVWRGAGGVEEPMEVSPVLQKAWDEGCRCATHRGSSCTTGWQPDEHCGCAP